AVPVIAVAEVRYLRLIYRNNAAGRVNLDKSGAAGVSGAAGSGAQRGQGRSGGQGRGGGQRRRRAIRLRRMARRDATLLASACCPGHSPAAKARSSRARASAWVIISKIIFES